MAMPFTPELSKTASDKNMLHVSNIIVSALSDQSLRVVRTIIDEPVEMIAKLDSRYE